MIPPIRARALDASTPVEAIEPLPSHRAAERFLATSPPPPAPKMVAWYASMTQILEFLRLRALEQQANRLMSQTSGSMRDDEESFSEERGQLRRAEPKNFPPPSRGRGGRGFQNPALILIAFLSLLASSSQASRKKLIIWSWDGAAYDEIAWLRAQGRLPNLERASKSGLVSALVPTKASKTAPGHARLWTGCDEDGHGITGNQMPDGSSGFSSLNLKAEPIWVAAVKQGLKVSAQVTHVDPFEPYLAGGRFGLKKEEADRLYLYTGYGGTRDDAGVRELHGQRIHIVEIGGHPFRVDLGAGRAVLYRNRRDDRGVRLREVSDGTEFQLVRIPGPPLGVAELGVIWQPPDAWLVHSPVGMVKSNHPKTLAGMYEESGAFWGTQAGNPYTSGKLGSPYTEHGDGRAEKAYLSLIRATVRYAVGGIRFGLKKQKAELVMAYVPYPDATSHMMDAYFRQAMEGKDSGVARRLAQTQASVYQILDEAFGEVLKMAQEEGAALAVVSDHGMDGKIDSAGPLKTGGHDSEWAKPERLQAIFYMAGPGVPARDLGPIPQRDACPTFCAYLGISPPGQATGQNRLAIP